ncbi:hypothetical protein ACTPEU_00125, partial [Clostridioides difficile]|uniref:hypothetical protein n=1 Tax=Clostridioides difficile TaxID=1496 RepID=UPI003F8D81C1
MARRHIGAVISLKDNMSATMRGIRREQKQFQNEVRRSIIIVCPLSLFILFSKSIISIPVLLSKFPVGSSANKISGFPIK